MTGSRSYHPEVKRLLDGELSLADLAPELRAEGEEALRLLGRVDRTVPTFSPWFEQQVMAAVRRRPLPMRAGWWAWLNESRPLRYRPRLALVAAALGVMALGLALRGSTPTGAPVAAAQAQTYVRFVLYAPTAHRVTLAGSFNGWDASQTPLVPTGTSGLWTVTVPLPAGNHLYGFMLDDKEWLPDPSAPAVDDGFGRRNSVLTVGPQEMARS
ncbi:MAG TPA: isoamylase early set domain-containing protein [Gemmatimonadales bacterium]|nr:isoamylase early set domain-containing protein [Gemmatimonadales bacterium]